MDLNTEDIWNLIHISKSVKNLDLRKRGNIIWPKNVPKLPVQ